MVEHSESVFFGLHVAREAQAAVLDVALELARSQRMPGRVFEPENFHITLCEIGRPVRLREPLPVAAMRSGDAVRLSQLVVVLDRATGFENGSRGFPNVLLPDETSARALHLLNESLRTAQLHNGLSVRKSYKPHLTLSRSSEHWLYEGPARPVRWLVTEFELIHSYYRDGRRIHDPLKRYPLVPLP